MEKSDRRNKCLLHTESINENAITEWTMLSGTDV